MGRILLEEYDTEPWGVLKPEYVIERPEKTFPEIVVCEFSAALIQDIVAKYEAKKVAR